MSDGFTELCEKLKSIIEATYNEGVTIPEAEKHAARFLAVQMELSERLASADLDARMKKAGNKAVRAAVYLEEATKGEKKPSDTFLEAIVSKSKIVNDAQNSLDEAEVTRDALQNYFNIFREAHIYYRGVAKGRFE